MHSRTQTSRPSLLASPLRLGAIAVGLIVVFTVLALLIVRMRWQNRLAAEIARIESAGEPVTIKDLYEFYSPSPEALAAGEEWMAAIAFTQTDDYQAASQSVPIVGRKDLVPADPTAAVAATEALLTRYRTEIDDLYAVIERHEVIGFPLNWEVPRSAEGQMTFANAIRLFRLDAETKCQNRDPDGAVSAILASLALAKSAGEEPSLAPQLIARALDGLAAEMTSLLLAYGVAADSQLAQIQEAFSSREYPQRTRSTYIAERAQDLHWWRTGEFLWSAEVIQDDFQEDLGAVWQVGRPNDALHYLSFMKQAIEVFDQRARRALAAANKLDHSTRNRRGIDFKATRFLAWRAELPAQVKSCYCALTDSRLTALACAIERWSLAEGDWPTSLEEVAERYPEVDVSDPWSDGAFQLRREDDGIVLYGVGSDGLDNGPSDSRFGSMIQPVFRIGPRPQPGMPAYATER